MDTTELLVDDPVCCVASVPSECAVCGGDLVPLGEWTRCTRCGLTMCQSCEGGR